MRGRRAGVTGEQTLSPVSVDTVAAAGGPRRRSREMLLSAND